MVDKKSFTYPYNASLEQKVVAIIDLLKEPKVEDIVFEIAELQAITSEEGIAECSINVEEVLNKLIKKNEMYIINTTDGAPRFSLK